MHMDPKQLEDTTNIDETPTIGKMFSLKNALMSSFKLLVVFPAEKFVLLSHG
mgnify:CR=1 FL=1